MTEQQSKSVELDTVRLNRMKWLILAEEKQNLKTRAYTSDQMVDRIRKIIEREANA